MELIKLRTDFRDILQQIYDIENNYHTYSPSRQMLKRKVLRKMYKEKNELMKRFRKGHYTYFTYCDWDGANNEWHKILEKAFKTKVPYVRENPWKPLGQVQIQMDE